MCHVVVPRVNTIHRRGQYGRHTTVLVGRLVGTSASTIAITTVSRLLAAHAVGVNNDL